MVVREGLDYYITCALRNTRIHMRQCITTASSTLKWLPGCTGSRYRPREKQRPIHYNIFRHVRTLADLTQNSVRWQRFQKPGSKKHRPDIDIHASLAVVTCFISTLVFTLRDLLNMHLADPKVDEFPFSIQSAILYTLLELICYAFVQPCSFGRSVSTRLAGRVINQFYTRYAIFLCSYCHLLELYVKYAAVYRTFIPQSY